MGKYFPRVAETYWNHNVSVEDIGTLLGGNVERGFVRRRSNLYSVDEIIGYGDNGQRKDIPVRYVIEKAKENGRWISYVLIRETGKTQALVANGSTESIDIVARKELDPILRKLGFSFTGYRNLSAEDASGFMFGHGYFRQQGK